MKTNDYHNCPAAFTLYKEKDNLYTAASRYGDNPTLPGLTPRLLKVICRTGGHHVRAIWADASIAVNDHPPG